MTKQKITHNLRYFIIILFGQFISNIGSYMTYFAIKIWAWELTNQVTTIALLSFVELIPSILMTLVSGLIVDRINRKFLLIIADCVAAISTIVIGYLYLTDQLQMWHIYVTGAVNGTFSEVQVLAYSSSISMLVPKQHYTRATSMNSAIHYGSIIIAPAASGFLYYIVNLGGILLIDFISFTIAIATILKVRIPQPKRTTQSKVLI